MIVLLIAGIGFAADAETSVTIQYDAAAPFKSADVSAELSLKPSSSFSYKVGFTTSGSSYNSPDIFGTAPFRLMLGATGPLTTENGKNFIGWKISRLDETGGAITWNSIPSDWESAVDSQSIEIMRYEYSGRGLPVEQNNRRLKIEPVAASSNISDYSATTYNAYLVLSLETIE